MAAGKNLLIVLFSFLLLSCSGSKSAKDVQPDLAAYLGKSNTLQLTPLTERELSYPVVVFEYSAEWTRNAAVDIKIVEKHPVVLTEFVHLQTTPGYSGQVIELPAPIPSFSSMIDLYFRVNTGNGYQDITQENIDEFLKQFSGTYEVRWGERPVFVLSGLKPGMEIEYTLIQKMGHEERFYTVTGIAGAFFRSLSVKFDLTNTWQSVQVFSNLNLTLKNEQINSILFNYVEDGSKNQLLPKGSVLQAGIVWESGSYVCIGKPGIKPVLRWEKGFESLRNSEMVKQFEKRYLAPISTWSEYSRTPFILQLKSSSIGFEDDPVKPDTKTENEAINLISRKVNAIQDFSVLRETGMAVFFETVNPELLKLNARLIWLYHIGIKDFLIGLNSDFPESYLDLQSKQNKISNLDQYVKLSF